LAIGIMKLWGNGEKFGEAYIIKMFRACL